MAQGKNIPRCHFLLIVIVIAIILIYKEFFKTMKISRIFFRIGLVKILIFCLFPKVIQYNTDYFMVIKKYIKEYSLEEKYLPQITPKGSQSSPQLFGNLL